MGTPLSAPLAYKAIKVLKDEDFLVAFTMDNIITFAINSDIAWKGTISKRDKNVYIFNKTKSISTSKSNPKINTADTDGKSVDELIDDLNVNCKE